MSVDFTPLLPLWAIVALGAVILLTAALRLRAQPIGALLRVLMGAAAVLFLLGPEHVRQTFDNLPNQALILLDQSASMELGQRAAIRDASAERLRETLEADGVEVATARFGDGQSSDVSEGLVDGLASVNRDQLGAVFVLTDGQVAGAEGATPLDLPVPVHGILTGAQDQEQDRRIAWVQEPRFGLVGEEVSLQFRIEDSAGAPTIPVTLRVDGETILSRAVPVGEDVTINLPADRPGERVIELGIETVPNELTTRNNAISTRVNVIRDRLRVLLISGEPHAGERVWRNVLKSDPAVDLVHFTILKPADKVAAAGPDDLNLIPFPSRELFLDKLQEFNVVIFDRYTYRGVISSFELAEVARFVDEGGAVLIAAGPELTVGGGLTEQPALSYILPALPNGEAIQESFVPTLTDLGGRHPITSSLTGREDWGRWLRAIPSTVRRGNVLMETEDGQPLLVTDRVGEGRVAMLLSDHLWLWARGFDGGGPHREFLRRLVHWLMAEPELEEEALTANLDAEGNLTVTRRTLSDQVGDVMASLDGAAPEALTLEERLPGQFSATVGGTDADRATLETATSGGDVLTAAAVRERGASSEFSAVTLTREALAPIVSATGGGFAAAESSSAPLPRLRTVSPSRGEKSGRGWLGITDRNARAILSEERAPLLPRWASLLIIAGLLLLAWLVESGRLTITREQGVNLGAAQAA
ncbi:hypothetical protein HK107_02210 [Parvularcula sp. ZS-1/3]|uniref:Glutamine amidotransferase domain-containing protein n=1 Tax=Parvularcula mediterranea TaxID=2732508 RepID=A0A7Y3RJC8_9PROT|nr:hypothetical protein [Parvularcula mediterranea]NNU15137.1 hypothetical protein [Parvularcula mediterranea]